MKFVGVDLAWGQRNWTGLCLVEGDTVTDSRIALSDGEILDWLSPLTAGPCLVAIEHLTRHVAVSFQDQHLLGRHMPMRGQPDPGRHPHEARDRPADGIGEDAPPHHALPGTGLPGPHECEPRVGSRRDRLAGDPIALRGKDHKRAAAAALGDAVTGVGRSGAVVARTQLLTLHEKVAGQEVELLGVGVAVGGVGDPGSHWHESLEATGGSVAEGGLHHHTCRPAGRPKRRTIRALARSGGAAPFTAAFLREYDLGPSASVARSLAQLAKREVLKKSEGGYGFVDPFFRAWVLSRMP